MSEEERCMPWYLPPLDSGTRLCSPFEALNFTNYINKMSYDECKVCMILVEHAWTHEPIFPALPARLRRDPLQSQCLGCTISWLRLQELWHFAPLQLWIHDNATHVGSKCDWAIQGRKNKISNLSSILISFKISTRSEGGVPDYLTSEVPDNRRYFTKGHVSIEKFEAEVLTWFHFLFSLLTKYPIYF